jgi:hypothetical protein
MRIPKIYLPGLISLLAVPWIISWYYADYSKRNNLNTIVLYWWEPSHIKSSMAGVGLVSDGLPAKRVYDTVLLAGDLIQSAERTFQAGQKIRTILDSRDTVTGVYFKFGNESIYGQFVDALDQCLINKAKTYMVNDKGLWVYNLLSPTRDDSSTIPTFTCGTKWLYDDESIRTSVNVKQLIQDNWLLLFAFCILAFVGFFSIRRERTQSFLNHT